MEVTARLIPPPRDDDHEDVHLALLTANALWGRGEREEALKWLRRAAEQASEVDADMRALELFKAAADIATKLTTPPPAPGPSAAPPAPGPSAAPPAPGPSAAPPAPGPSAAPPPQQARPAAPAPPAPARNPSAAPPPQAAARTPSTAPHPPPQPIAQARAPSGAPPATRSEYPPPAQPAAARRSAQPPAREAGAPQAARGAAQPRQDADRQRQAAAPATGADPRVPRAEPAAPAAAHDPRRAPQGQASQPPPQAAPEAQPQRRAARQPRVVTQIGLAPPAAVQHLMRPGAQPPAQQQRAAHPQQRGAHPQQPAAHPQQRAAHPQQPAAPQPAASEPDPGPPTAPRRRLEEEMTQQQDVHALWREQERELAAAAAADALAHEHPELAGARVDDLDEDTRVLDGARTDHAPLVFDPPRDGAPPPAAYPEAWAGAAADSGTAGETLAEAGLTGRLALAAAAAPAGEDLSDTSQGAPDPTWASDPTRWHAPPAPRVPAVPVEPLPALRVAVLATSTPGEVRLVLLDERTEPPAGAAAAILVPLSALDGAAIARLLSGS